MHMNSVPQHLLNEDRPEYERILDEALRSAPHRPEPAAVGQQLNPEQLRTMALTATALITAAAATEYQHYVKVREELRQPAPSTPRPSAGPAAPRIRPRARSGLATTMGEVAETAGAGAAAVVAVLAPVLAGTAAAIFLLVGYILTMLDPRAGHRPDPAHHGLGVRRHHGRRDPGRRGRPAAHRAAQRRQFDSRPAARRTQRRGDPGQGRLARRPAGARHPAVPAGRPSPTRARPPATARRRRRRSAGCPTSATAGPASAARTAADTGSPPQLLQPGLQQPRLRGAGHQPE